MVDMNPSDAVRLSLLENDMLRANTSLDKLQSSMEKHREESNHNTEKIYDRMEDLRTELKEDIHSLKADLERQITKQNEILTKISDKMDGLDKWRWIVVGMATVAGFVASKLFGLFGVIIK